MIYSSFFLTAWVFASCAAASVASRALGSSAGAAYFIIDDPAQKLVSVNIASDGTLGPFVRVFNAGGTGQRVIHIPPPGKPASLFSPGPDPLFGQGSVRVHQDAGILVTVNPGSNTVALFKINPQDPTQLTPIGKPVSSGGEFPHSVTINSKGTAVCVSNGGVVNGVNCFTVHPTTGLVPKPDTLRFLNLTETEPVSGPFGTLSTIVFSLDDSKLVVAVKGTASANGYLATWNVNPDGSLSKDFVKTFTDTGFGEPFALAPIPGTNAFLAADPTIGISTYDFGSLTSLVATVRSTEISNQILNCWTAYSSKSGSFFTMDPGTSTINEFHFDAKLNPTLVNQYPQTPNSGTLDSTVAIVGHHAYLYVLEPLSTSIGVLLVDKAGSAPTLQTFNLTTPLKAAGLTTYDHLNFQGMATFIRD